jgi:hypothetical protein
MAEFYRPREQEAGIDKFLRRLGSVAQLGAQGYGVYKDIKDRPLERKMKELEVQKLETETGLLPQKYAKSAMDNDIEKQYKLAQIEEIRRKPQKEEQERQFKEKEFGLRQEERKDTLQSKQEEKQAAKIDKLKKEQTEVDYRENSINSSLNQMEDIIKKYGTFEVFGPQSEQLESLIFNTALDYAKLVDPDSVAREGEVAAAKKYSLAIKGLGVSNASALQLINDMRKKTQERASFLRQAKGLNELVSESQPQEKNLSALIQQKQQAPQQQLSSEDQMALDWANKNPNDPRASEIKKRLGK